MLRSRVSMSGKPLENYGFSRPGPSPRVKSPLREKRQAGGPKSIKKQANVHMERAVEVV